jgi:hypothetical protein
MWSLFEVASFLTGNDLVFGIASFACTFLLFTTFFRWSVMTGAGKRFADSGKFRDHLVVQVGGLRLGRHGMELNYFSLTQLECPVCNSSKEMGISHVRSSADNLWCHSCIVALGNNEPESNHLLISVET